jgi:hypothetical protein
MASRKLGAALAATVLALLAAPLSSSTAAAAAARPFAQTAEFSQLSGTSSDAVAPAVKAATTTKVTESAAAVNYGNESSVQFTVEVTGGSTEGETAEVKVGSGSDLAACIAHLSGAGVGTCAVEPNDALPAAFASYAVSAHFAGDGSLEPSEGTIGGGLTVTAGRSFTTVSVSPAKLNYGSESPVAVTARVTAEGNAPLPSGETAQIQLGSETCTASLSGGAVSTGTCSISTTPELPPGSYAITAEYGGDLNLSGSGSSSSLSLTVEGTSTPFTIGFVGVGKSVASPASIVFGSTITLEETGLPTQAQGTVTFNSGTTELCSFTLSAGTTSCATSNQLAASTYAAITAKFEPTSGNFVGSTSGNTLSLTVQPAATKFTITVEPATILAGETATLAESGLPEQAGGVVTFSSGGSPLCSFTLSTSPKTTSCKTSTALAPGEYAGITAAYTPASANYKGSIATSSLTLTVASKSTKFTIGFGKSVVSPASIVFGSTITLEETGLPAQAQGTVTFASGPTELCSFTLAPGTSSSPGTSSCNTPGELAAGTYAGISATFVATGGAYSGSTFTSSLSLTVQRAETSFAITINGAAAGTAAAGTSATLAEVGLPAGVRGTVAFSWSGGALCTATLPATSCATSAGLAVGTYAGITATFTDTDGNHGGSNSTGMVALTVERLASVVSVTSSPSPSTPYTSLTLTARVVSKTPASLAPTGVVTFMSGTHTLGTGTLDGSGVARLSTSAPGPGSYYASAVYGGDRDYSSAGSPTIIQTVKETFAGLFGLTTGYLYESPAYRKLTPKRRIATDGELAEINRLLDVAAAKSSKSVLASTIYDAAVTVMKDERLLTAAQAEGLIKLADGLPAPNVVAVASLGRRLKGHTVAVGALRPGNAELSLRALNPPHGDTYRLVILTRAQGQRHVLLSRVLTIA